MNVGIEAELGITFGIQACVILQYKSPSLMKDLFLLFFTNGSNSLIHWKNHFA